jgi:hypothetical protein
MQDCALQRAHASILKRSLGLKASTSTLATLVEYLMAQMADVWGRSNPNGCICYGSTSTTLNNTTPPHTPHLMSPPLRKKYTDWSCDTGRATDPTKPQEQLK